MTYDLSIKGNMPENELKILERWSAELPKPTLLVEVGSLYGRSAICFALSLSEGSQVYCFDRWDGEDAGWAADAIGYDEMRARLENVPWYGDNLDYDVFLRNTAKYSNIHSKHIRSGHPSEIEWNNGQVDAVFLDTEHVNPADWLYIEYWIPLIKSGGYLMGHDYGYSYLPDVTENVHRVEDMWGVKAEIEQTLWRVKKP